MEVYEMVKRNLNISSVIHWLAYILLIINLFYMNLNVLIGRPSYLILNISLSLLAFLLCSIVLYMRKGIDSTPLIGILINVFSIIIVVGPLYFYEG